MVSKIELVDRVLQGKTVTHPPVSFWYHFGVQHMGGDLFAKITLDYFFHYDLDFLKVMNDYFYPLPSGVPAIRTKADLEALTRFDPRATHWRQQYKALEIIANALDSHAYFIDTVFDPWQSLNRYVSAEHLRCLMEDEPQALLDALDVVTDNLIDYCKQSIAIGAAGIFLSLAAGVEIVERNHFLTFIKPFAQKLLHAIDGMGGMTTLHVHGKDLYFDDVLDLPAPVFNWWDRGPNGPDLQSVLASIDGCVMGGVDQTLMARRSQTFLKQHTRQALELGGARRYIMANGCSIDTWVHPQAIKTIVDEVRRPV